MEVFENYSIDFESPYYKMILNGKTDLKIADKSVGLNSVDPGREYRKNNYGYRSEEFSSDAGILIAGCSNTFGMGLDESLRWGDVLAEKLNVVPQTISESGMSISWLVEKIILHISIFGAPRRVVCLFPDFFRGSIVIDSKVLKSDLLSKSEYRGYEKLNNSQRGQAIIHTGNEEDLNKQTKYLKRPFDAEAVVSRDMALHQSIRSIRLLEKYCNDLKIPFIWSTWDNNSSKIVQTISTTEYKFDNFVDVINNSCATYRKYTDKPKDVIFKFFGDDLKVCQSRHRNVECDCYLQCHDDYRELVGFDQFYMASDTINGPEYAHYGAHVHIHFAEAFLDELSRIE